MNVHLKKPAQVALSKKKKSLPAKQLKGICRIMSVTMNNYPMTNISMRVRRLEMNELCKKMALTIFYVGFL